METYTYDGAVLSFNKIIVNNCHLSTYAPSEEKAKSNFQYQCKKKFGLLPSASVSLPGKIKNMSREEY